jgi:hypothetical protein
LDLLRRAGLDFLTGLRAGLLATAFFAVALRDDFFTVGFLTAAALTDRFAWPCAHQSNILNESAIF